jgi:hypothetical protein
MARTLSPRDLEILKKLAPELDDPLCPASGHEFFSILPPVANHFATDDLDFIERVKRLTPDELAYLVGLILNGSESVGCIPPESLILFVEHIADVISLEAAEKIVTIYQFGASCEDEECSGQPGSL